jgi:hypothetical protein
MSSLRSIRTLHGSPLITVCLLLASVARADADDNPFGAKGQVVPFGAVSFQVDFGKGARNTEGVDHDVWIGLSPGMLYFFAPNLAVGASLDFSYDDRELETRPYTELDFGASVGFGFHAPFSANLGLFPRLWLGAGYMRREYVLFDFEEPLSDPTFAVQPSPVTQGSYVNVQLLVPLSFQLASATFISIGPSARLQWALKQGSRTFDFALSAGIGRYF